MKTQNIISSYKTHIGKVKAINEDRVCVFDNLNAAKSIESLGCLYAVADGLGGHKGGEKASLMACEGLNMYYEANPPRIGPEPLKEIIISINQAIFAESMKGEDYFGMATTLSAVLFLDGQTHVVNIGDSRVYIFRGDKLERLSKDDRVLTELIKHVEITEEQALEMPEGNKMTQALGAKETCDVHTRTIELRCKDYFLVCSDGLTDMVIDKKIEETFRKYETPEEIAENLLNIALTAGGKDNISLIVIMAL